MIFNKLTPAEIAERAALLFPVVRSDRRVVCDRRDLETIFGELDPKGLVSLREVATAIAVEASTWTRFTSGRSAKVVEILNSKAEIAGKFSFEVSHNRAAVRFCVIGSEEFGIRSEACSPSEGVFAIFSKVAQVVDHIQEEDVADFLLPEPARREKTEKDALAENLDAYFDALDEEARLEEEVQGLEENKRSTEFFLAKTRDRLLEEVGHVIVTGSVLAGEGSARARVHSGPHDEIVLFEVKIPSAGLVSATCDYVRAVAKSKASEFCDLAQTAIVWNLGKDQFEILVPSAGAEAIESDETREIVQAYLAALDRVEECDSLIGSVKNSLHYAKETIAELRPTAKIRVEKSGPNDCPISVQIVVGDAELDQKTLRGFIVQDLVRHLSDQGLREVAVAARHAAISSLDAEDFRGRLWKEEVADVITIA